MKQSASSLSYQIKALTSSGVLATMLAMMLVAVIALSGSTFAWFAQNSSVTAEKVTVTAETAKNLSISTTGEDNSWQTNVDLTNVDAGTKFWPVAATENSEFIGTSAAATLNSQDGAQFYAIKSTNKVASADAAAAAVSIVDALGNDTLLSENFVQTTAGVWTQSVWLNYDYIAGEKSTVGAIVTVYTSKSAFETKDIDKAMHVAFATEAKSWRMVEVDGTPVVTEMKDENDNVLYKVELTVSDLLQLTAGTKQKVNLYIWFEGEDTDCFTNASLAPQPLTTAFEFHLQ